MADKVQFELVSPEKILVAESVDMVVIPGTEGYFGVLPGHSPLISSVRPGTIDVYDGDKIAERIFVAGGFAEVTATRCTVLADVAVSVSSLDRATIEADLQRLEGEIAGLRAESESGKLKAAERARDTAVAQLEALGLSAGH